MSFQSGSVLYKIIAVVLFLQLQNAEGYNILGVFTSKSPSHLIVHMSVMKTLAERGHNVTVVTSQEPIVNHPAIKVIFIPPLEKHTKLLNEQLKELSKDKPDIMANLKVFAAPTAPIVDMQLDVLKDERFKALYEPGNKFDLVIMGYFVNDFQVGLGRKFNCPLIIDWMTEPNIFINKYVGNPEETSYVPSLFLGIPSGRVLTFKERLKNFVARVFFFGMQSVINLKMERFYKELFQDEQNFPSFDEMKKNVSLIFVNSHFSEGTIRPNVPAIIEVGGIQIKEKPDPLPKDIAEFLDNSKEHGAILLSLGTNLLSSNIRPEIVQSIFKTLSNLKQNVIWKWENLDNIPGKSPNILYKKWVPQDDILAHPNLKVFITHAGKGGIAESQYHGVPMVALPVFGDQPSNAAKMVASGYGVQLELKAVTEKLLTEAILEVIYNDSYAVNVKKYSELYMDRPITAKELIIYWTEYVIRHHGANHMQSPLVHMNIIQSTSVDVFAFILLVIYISWKVIKLVFKLLGKLFRSKSKKVKLS